MIRHRTAFVERYDRPGGYVTVSAVQNDGVTEVAIMRVTRPGGKDVVDTRRWEIAPNVPTADVMMDIWARIRMTTMVGANAEMQAETEEGQRLSILYQDLFDRIEEVCERRH